MTFKTLYVCLLLSILGIRASAISENECCDFYNSGNLYYDNSYPFSSFYGRLGYTLGKGVGIDKPYATAGLTWFPDRCCSSFIQTFADAAAHRIENGDWATTIGIGFRKLDYCNWVFGANLYYDYRQGHVGDYHQLGLGLEWLNPCLDVRINGYLPISDKCHSSRDHVFNYPGGFIMTCREFECAMSGVDAEIGKTLWCCKGILFYGAIGGYYWSRNHLDHAAGGLIRLSGSWNNWISLEMIATHDHLFRSRVQGVVSVRVPFEFLNCCFSSCAPSCDWWTQPVRRQPLIVLDNTCCWTTNF